MQLIYAEKYSRLKKKYQKVRKKHGVDAKSSLKISFVKFLVTIHEKRKYAEAIILLLKRRQDYLQSNLSPILKLNM